MSEKIRTDFIGEPLDEATPEQLLQRMFSDQDMGLLDDDPYDVNRKLENTRDAMGRLLSELYDAGVLSISAIAEVTETPRDSLLPEEDL